MLLYLWYEGGTNRDGTPCIPFGLFYINMTQMQHRTGVGIIVILPVTLQKKVGDELYNICTIEIFLQTAKIKLTILRLLEPKSNMFCAV